MSAVAPIGSTVNLAFQVVILALILTGFLFARRRKFSIHEKWMSSGIVLAAISFFTWMAPSYIRNFNLVVTDFFAPGIVITDIHAVFGVITGTLALYIIAIMKLNIPERFAVKRVKRLMRTTLTLWFITFFFGVLFYIYYFVL